MSHEWTMKFMEHRVADPRILRLIRKWLKAGVSEDGKWSETKAGTPQGAVISPLLANVYLHYVFDLWVEVWRRKVASGELIVIRYADDRFAVFLPARRSNRAATSASSISSVSRDIQRRTSWDLRSCSCPSYKCSYR